MRTVIAERPGPPDVLRPVELPDPEPHAGHVLVDVEAAAVVFIDTQMRAGTPPPPLPAPAFPLTPGNGVGGTVTAVGEGVDAAWLGRPVVTTTGGRGGYASRVVVAVDDLHRVPEGLDVRTAVALLADGRTAVGLARAAAIEPGDTVVVTAAAGGVGSLLVQLGSNADARVVGLAGGGRKLAHARELGAVAAIDYRDSHWPAHLDAAAPDGLQIVFDGVGGPTSRILFDRVVPGGRYLPHGVASGIPGEVPADEAGKRGVEIVPLSAIGGSARALRDLVEEALRLASAGLIRPTIGQTWPLAQAADAHAAIEARTTLGKTLLIP